MLIAKFGNQGLSPRDMTALSGAHTIGLARCSTFRDRIYNDSNIEAAFANQQQLMCPKSGNDTNLAAMDVKTAMAFDAAYFQNLMDRRGLFHSDQELYSGGSQDALVRQYSGNPAIFRDDFARAMVKLGNIKPLTGTAGQIRTNCRVVNRKIS
jgi:peroxidase